MSRFKLTATAIAFAALAATPAVADELSALWAELSGNPAGFKQKYNNRAMSVTGPVGNINVEVTPGTVGLAEPSAGNSTVLFCYISDADKRRAASLSRGQRITVRGTMVNAGPSGMWLQPCAF